jgi:heterogeneous nuclear ribonucleoprotein M
MGDMEGPFGDGMENRGRFASGMNMSQINEILSNALKRGEIIAKQGGGRGEGSPRIKRMGPAFTLGWQHRAHGHRPGPRHG